MTGLQQAQARILRSSVFAPFERLRDSLSLSASRERNAAIVIACYTAFWTLIDTTARRAQDIHHDMGETFAWSHDLVLGGYKHPPLTAWIAGLWFSIFPQKDWAFYLLTNAMIALALWTIWRLSARWLDGDKRVAGLALLTFVPFFNVFAWKFNCNTVLIPLWALTTLAFVRSLETRTMPAAALAGAAAAAAMMGKYWSVFLLIGLGLAALTSPYRREYFRSLAPWTTVAAGALLLVPHVWWLAAHGFPSFNHAVDTHTAKTLAEMAKSALIYLSGFFVYLSLPALLVAFFAWSGWAAVWDSFLPESAERRFAAVAFWLPVLLPLPVALALGVDLSAIWTMSCCALFPVVLLSSPKLRISREAVTALLALSAVFSLAMLAAAPTRARRAHEAGSPNFSADYRLAAKTVQDEWRKVTDAPLRIVGSYSYLVYGASFYFPDRPSIFDLLQPETTPWVDERRIRKQGIAIVCPVEIGSCTDAAERFVEGREVASRNEVTLARSYHGAAGAPHRFLILIVPPGMTGN